jgi:hypothetical protein
MSLQHLACIFSLLVLASQALLITQRTDVPPSFKKLSRADPTQLHQFKISFKQRNLDVLAVCSDINHTQTKLTKVERQATIQNLADPDSSSYGTNAIITHVLTALQVNGGQQIKFWT